MTSNESATAVTYDGFISYSHAADGLLAPRLQAGLQRFAKPWWKRRAVRLFRDEASLSANPHLWSSITEALDASEWFVLLLSPEATESEWVNREVEYWKTHKDKSRILPVLTDGYFEWSEGDVAGSAVPDQLRGVFSEEPRWVDLRFAGAEEQLDLKHPRFAEAVADIASALRGVPKDELASEEVRQHRRTLRTAWAAGALLVLLAVAAVVFGIQSARNAQEAVDQREIARLNARIAEEKAADEQQARLEAEEATAKAERQADISEAGRLIANSLNVVNTDPELAALLALQARMIAPNDEPGLALEIGSALGEAVQANRLEKRFPIPRGFNNKAVISPDGTMIYHADSETMTIRAFSVESEEVFWSKPVQPGVAFEQLHVNPNGTQLVVSVAQPGGDEPAQVVVFRTSTGDLAVDKFEPGGCSSLLGWGSGFSPDGSLFTFTTGNAECREHGDNDWAVVYDTSDWTPEVERVQVSISEPQPRLDPREAVFPVAGLDGLHFSSDSTTVLLSGFFARTEVRTFPDFDLIRQFGQGASVMSTLSPDGQLAVIQPMDEFTGINTYPLVVSVSDDSFRFEIVPPGDPGFVEFKGPVSLPSVLRRPSPVSFSPDSQKVALHFAGGRSSVTYIFEDRQIPVGDRGATLQHSWTKDSNFLLTVGEAGWMHLWNVSPTPAAQEDFGGLLPDDLVPYALQSLTRSFTNGECLKYNISPCPTISDLTGS